MKKIASFALVFLFLATLATVPILQRAPQAAATSASPAAPSSVASPLTAASIATDASSAPASSSPSAPSAPPTLPALSRLEQPAVPTSPNAIAARFASAATAADLLEAADLTDPVQRAYLVALLSEMHEAQRETALATAERLGIPVRIEGPGRKVSILYDFRDGRPLYRTTLNANAAISTGANQLRDLAAPYGLTGSGLRVGVWDEAKVRNTHQEFAGGRVTIKDSASTFSDHATHVAGTIGATGTVAAAKGMAPQVGIDSYDWNNDYAEMTAAGAATATDTTKLSLSNHSYGYDAVTADMGRYETEARTLDALASALPHYQIFWAAGNEQDLLTAQGGYQSITFAGLAKNVITIAAGDDAVSVGLRAPAAGTLASFSSLGPCDDGRVKPDLTANGVDLYSPVATNNTAYDGAYSGTSMATPNALGSALLVQQLYAREFAGQRLRASTLKALLIQTADDVGRPGPDYQYGWGYLNARAAADLVLAHKASLASPKLLEGTLTNAAKTRTHTFTWDGVTPIRATLAWTDPAGAAQTAADSRTANLVHDLDLRLTAPDGTTTTLPYVMPFVGTWTLASMTQNATTGANHVDTVEQVRVATPSQPGNYTLTVALTGSLTTASQVYSLVITGGANVEANPAPVVTFTSPADGAVVLPGSPLTLSATATDNTLGGGPGVVANVEFFAGTTSLGLVSSSPYTLAWTPPSAGAYSLTAVATDTEGAAGTSAVARITVLSGDGSPTLAGLAPG
ncbi:MAG: S8 family serine peptidase, partial [Burkholderiales bacterium]|nr:S8 family serine peptidase [Opitutaceae bacterium]